MPDAPQIPRLLRLIDDLRAPLVQVWGWPGSGRSALLAALVERCGARGLPAEALASEASARKAIREALRGALDGEGEAGGEGVLVCPGLPRGTEGGAVLRALTEAVPAGRKLVVATAERWPEEGVPCGLVTPRDLALRPEEVAALWRRETGRELPADGLARLVRLTGGWWRVVALVAAGAREAEDVQPDAGLPADGAALVAMPAVADFLRFRVLADLGDEERAALADPDDAPERLVRRLREVRGLLLEEPDGSLRPPAPLAALLDLDRNRELDRNRDRGRARAEPESFPAPGPAAHYRLRLLGPPEVARLDEGGTWRPVRFTLKRGLRLLAYLATAPERTALREELIEALWPEEDREVIERNFHPTLSHLRRDLRRGEEAAASRSGTGAATSRADLLVFRDGHYILDPSVEWWIDAEELVRLVEEGKELAEAGRDVEAVERWEAAWRLYRGPLLEGIYDPWAAGRRERIQRRHLALLRDLGRADERLGRANQALDAYRSLLVDDPLEEKVHVALMRLYAARGRRDLVRRQYERLSLLLRTELGIEPMPETAEEYHRLMIERG